MSQYTEEREKINAEEYKYFDLYWVEQSRVPLLIKAQQITVGFALLNSHVLVTQTPAEKSIAEFYILPQYRRLKYGQAATRKIFKKFKGTWEISQMKKNIVAQKFWKNVIQEYTAGNYKERALKFENSSWLVLLFES